MRFVPVTLRAANDFVNKYHRHNKAVVGHKFSIGLEEDGELIGVGIAGRPVARMLDNSRNIEIVRVCIKEGHKNACSKMYARMKRLAQLMGYEKIITYTLKSESQSSLKAIGAIPESVITPYQWDRAKRRRKPQDVYNEDKIRWELNPATMT